MQYPVVLLAIGLVACGGAHVNGQWASPRGEVTFPDSTRVTVEIADTDAKRQRGLMFRERMAPGDGMIFLFDEPGNYPFWMKNTLIPLDMIWLDKDARIVWIAESVPPCKADPCPSYDHKGQALYVVEVVSGFAKQHKLKVGDKLVLEGIKRP
ncbi:MAG TPA: DUF192 domain-containing protein [Vicinamibacterales bacterium]|nr:DUF192 domain-containing protein [Vicinamibacterales bacterium]